MTSSAAQFEIKVDGVVRRDRGELGTAIEICYAQQ
jgi:hypothetical protein